MTIDYSVILTMQANKLADVINGNEFAIWQNSTIRIVGRAFGEDSRQVKELDSIKYRASESPAILENDPGLDFDRLSRVVNINNVKLCVDTSRKLILSFVDELTSLTHPSLNDTLSTEGINKNVSQNQTDNVQLAVNILREELTGEQYQVIEQLLKSDKSLAEKRKDLFDKLTSFGSDVASNVLASLLTNPQVYQAFI